MSAFFRKFEEKLTLTATFRTHNALDAWLLNFYGLMAFQSAVAKKAGIVPGAITVFSHSISIDPKELDRALMVAEKRKWKMHLDPMGYFRITLDGKEILVEHRFEDVTLKEYRGKRPRPCSTRSPGTWPSRTSTTPSIWGANWPRPRWPSKTAGSSCRISGQRSRQLSAQARGLAKVKCGVALPTIYSELFWRRLNGYEPQVSHPGG